MKVSIWFSTDFTSLSRPVEGLVQLARDGLQLGDAAAVEQQRQRAEHLFDLGVAPGPRRAGSRRRRPGGPPRRRPPSGGSRETNFSPRRLVCRILATALPGSSTSPRTSTVTTAVDRRASMSSTLPTVTSSTLTADCGTRSSTSRNCTFTEYGLSPRSAPPGSGQVVDGEVAAGQGECAHRPRRPPSWPPGPGAPASAGALLPAHLSTSRIPPRDRSTCSTSTTFAARVAGNGEERLVPGRPPGVLDQVARLAPGGRPGGRTRTAPSAGSLSSWPMFSPMLVLVSSVPASGL